MAAIGGQSGETVIQVEKKIKPAELKVKLHKQSCIISLHDEYLYHPFYIDGNNPLEGPISDSKRGAIESSSQKSRRRARLLLEDNRDTFITKACLTYPEEFPLNGRVVKRHFDNFMKRTKRYCGADTLYFQILEFQRRGAPHLHLLLNKYIPVGWVSKAWFETVGSGDPRHLEAGTQIKKIEDPQHDFGYLTTYLGKEYQKMVPKNFGNVGRFWSSNITLKEAQTITIKGDYKRLQQIYKVMQETYRKERLEVWSKKSGKDYSFKEREFPGFTAWASSEMMAEIIQHELGKHEQQDRPGQSPGLPHPRMGPQSSSEDGGLVLASLLRSPL